MRPDRSSCGETVEYSCARIQASKRLLVVPYHVRVYAGYCLQYPNVWVVTGQGWLEWKPGAIRRKPRIASGDAR